MQVRGIGRCKTGIPGDPETKQFFNPSVLHFMFHLLTVVTFILSRQMSLSSNTNSGAAEATLQAGITPPQPSLRVLYPYARSPTPNALK